MIIMPATAEQLLCVGGPGIAGPGGAAGGAQPGTGAVQVVGYAPITTGASQAAADIYEWDFAGATDVIASGAFTYNGGTPGTHYFINNPSESGPGWNRDNSIYYTGSQSVRMDVPISGGNTGSDFFVRFSTLSPSVGDQSTVYVRWAWYQSSDCDNDYPIKVVRILDGFAKVISWMPNANGPNVWRIHPEQYSGGAAFGPNMNTAVAPATPNAAKDAWHVYEMGALVTGTSCRCLAWIDGTQKFDVTVTGGPAWAIDGVQFDGTINASDQTWEDYYDYVAISTTPIGV